MSRKGTDVAVGIAGAVMVFAAVPSVLVLLVGDPIPTHWSRAALLSLHGLFEALAIVAWCSWAVCAWSLWRSVVVRVRTRDISVAPRLVDQLAVRIAVAILAIAPAGIMGAGAASAATLRQPPAASAPPARPIASAEIDHAAPVPGGGVLHVVGAGDTLALIATERYGDRSAWPAIAGANLGRVLGDGARFVDPSQVRDGWTLVVPSLDTDVHEASGSSVDAQAAATSISTVATAAEADAAPEGHLSPSGRRTGAPAPLPELAVIGVGSLVAALLARRARQARRLRSLTRDEGSTAPPPSDDAASLARVLAPFERTPILELVEAGLGHLAATARGLPSALPAIEWVRAGSVGLDVHFAADPPPPSAPWVQAAQRVWRLPASLVPPTVLGGDNPEACCPVLVPVGDGDDATWLLPIHVGGCLALLGPHAPQLALAMQVAASRWAWHEAVLVTVDAAAAINALGTGPQPPCAEDSGLPYVLFVGDPGVLPPAVRARCAVLTTEATADADVTVVVDRHGATIHPYGVALRPHLLEDRWAGAVADVAPPTPAGAATRDPAARSDGGSRAAPLRHATAPSVTTTLPTARATTTDVHLPSPLTSGSVDVRLLAALPRIDGLRGELPPKRVRRVTELIAYLAVHSPAPVTGDRLRTRVLGTTDTDAAAKTLFNTAYAARRALGLGPDGAPLLPPATRAGHYRLSPHVTVDARRAVALIEAGLGARSGGADGDVDDGEAPLALVERGLDLIEGEPLGGMLTGFAWWRAEGHERQLADLVVDGACALVRGALAAGEVDRARWALTRARRVETYSEALTRAAMEVAAASGDAARLRAEWVDCCCQMDEIDPGGTPSARTERLYAHLRAQLGVDQPTYEVATARP